MENVETKISEGTTAVTQAGLWQDRFFAALSEFGIIGVACKIACVSRETVRRHRRRSDFEKRYKIAMREAADRMEAEAWRRAVTGVEEPVFHNGQRVDAVRKYDTTLLIFLMKGARPKKFRDNMKIESHVTGKIRHTVSQQVPDLLRQRAAQHGVSVN